MNNKQLLMRVALYAVGILAVLGWLRLHDARVRETAAYERTADSLRTALAHENAVLVVRSRERARRELEVARLRQVAAQAVRAEALAQARADSIVAATRAAADTDSCALVMLPTVLRLDTLLDVAHLALATLKVHDDSIIALKDSTIADLEKSVADLKSLAATAVTQNSTVTAATAHRGFFRRLVDAVPFMAATALVVLAL